MAHHATPLGLCQFGADAKGGKLVVPVLIHTRRLLAEEDIDEVRWVDSEMMAEVRRDTYPSLQRVFNAWEEARRGPA